MALAPLVPSEPVPDRIMPKAFSFSSLASDIINKSTGKYVPSTRLIRRVIFNFLREIVIKEFGGIA
ncbi:MAG: hypothetical protein ACD_79C00023G0003 [uncultured bacterium]|nr:MAG: hypothetical protein ACD_79C00023G0003 [uncultured bacterium]